MSLLICAKCKGQVPSRGKVKCLGCGRTFMVGDCCYQHFTACSDTCRTDHRSALTRAWDKPGMLPQWGRRGDPV